MKIAIDCRILTAPRRSGVLVYVEQLLENLALLDRTNRYDLLLLGLSRAAREVRPVTGSNFNTWVFPVPDRDFAGKRELLNGAVLPAFFTLRGTTLYHLPVDYHLPADHHLPWRERVRKVITIHDLRGLYEIPGDVPQDVEGLRRSARRADMIITVSEFTRRDVVERFGVPEERVRVTHLGVDRASRVLDDPAALQRVRARLGLHGPYFLSLGLVPRKNIERLLLAYDAMRGRDHVTLVLAGHLTDSPWCRRYRELIAERRLEGRVLVTGAVSDEELALLYSGARAFVFPSLLEGFGLPVLEAMTSGAPVITSNSSALPEVVGDAALLVDPHDVESIRGAMERLLEEEELRRQLVSRGRRRAGEFSWRRMAGEVLAAYEATV
jgi:glycosyltransferase involved in cell wall biosynthesis